MKKRKPYNSPSASYRSRPAPTPVCSCTRTASINAKCSDRCSIEIPHLDFETDGYVMDIGVGSGDYVEFEFCLDCGKIQGFKPVTDEAIKASEEWEEIKGTPEEQEAEDTLVAAEPDVISLKALTTPEELPPKEVEKRRIHTLMTDAFGLQWQVNLRIRNEVVEVLENTLEKDNCGPHLSTAIMDYLKEMK